MHTAPTNRLLEALGGLDAADTAARLQEQPGLAALFSLLFVAGLASSVVALVWMARRRPKLDLLLNRPWSGLDVIRLLALLLGLLCIYAAGSALLHRVRPDVADSPLYPAAAAAGQTLVFHWPVLLFVLVAGIRRRVGPRAGFGIEARRCLRDAGLGVFFYVAALPAIAAVSFAARAILRAAGLDAEPQDVVNLMVDGGTGWWRVYLIGLGVALAPIAEELLFRGIALPVLARRIGATGALVATAAVFAAVHGNASAAAPLFVLGLVFGLAYLYTGSLAPAIVLHSVFNAVSIAVSHALPAAGGVPP